ncbi:hypothetical protein V8D89_003222 [Ganoderma adspersum]
MPAHGEPISIGKFGTVKNTYRVVQHAVIATSPGRAKAKTRACELCHNIHKRCVGPLPCKRCVQAGCAEFCFEHKRHKHTRGPINQNSGGTPARTSDSCKSGPPTISANTLGFTVPSALGSGCTYQALLDGACLPNNDLSHPIIHSQPPVANLTDYTGTVTQGHQYRHQYQQQQLPHAPKSGEVADYMSGMPLPHAFPTTVEMGMGFLHKGCSDATVGMSGYQ